MAKNSKIELCIFKEVKGVRVNVTKIYDREAWAWKAWHRLTKKPPKNVLGAEMVHYKRGYAPLKLTVMGARLTFKN